MHPSLPGWEFRSSRKGCKAAEAAETDFYVSDSEADIEFTAQNTVVIFDLRNSRALPFYRVQA
jgi:hypothetical protein